MCAQIMQKLLLVLKLGMGIYLAILFQNPWGAILKGTIFHDGRQNGRRNDTR